MIELKLNNFPARAIAIIAFLAVCAPLTYAAVTNCAAGMLTDQRAAVSKELLAAGIDYLPNSALLNARLAEAQMREAERDITSVENLARRAVDLSPWDYRHRLLLATVEEARGDRAAAERSLLEGIALAPNYTEVHWRLANLLLREGKLGKSVVEFRAANSSNPQLLLGSLDLLWRVSAGNLATVQAVTPRDPQSQIVLAQYLLKQSRASDAITVFGGIDRNVLIGLRDSPAFINSLISDGRFEEARGLWVGLVSGGYAQPGHPLPGVWNGGFESDILPSLAQFDWMISRNEYAEPAFDLSAAHTGSRSLRIDFTGRDTTRLDGQIKQMLVVRPGAVYRLDCYVKTERLETPEGPRVTVIGQTSSAVIATSDPIATGSSDWRRIGVDFTAPQSEHAVVVTIKRIPKFVYDNPTRGTVWFDDFVLTEQGK
ncbi:MAG: hypothetical protein WAV20_04115 [Blastocatellia bacterium]